MLTSLAIFYHLSLKANIQSIRTLKDNTTIVQYKLQTVSK